VRKEPYSITVLQIKTKSSYEENLDLLIKYIKEHQSQDLIIAPEVCLTGFDYENFSKAGDFFDIVMDAVLPLITTQILVLTLIKKEHENMVNQAVVIHDNQVVYSQNKYKLFIIGDETKYFFAGEQSDIAPFTINGIKYALLICFELRFKELWRQIEGVDIVLVPAMWGKTRKRHIEVLTQALAIMNQSFVVLADSANDDMAKSSSIISPWGDVVIDDEAEVINHTIDLKEVKKVRRMISMR